MVYLAMLLGASSSPIPYYARSQYPPVRTWGYRNGCSVHSAAMCLFGSSQQLLKLENLFIRGSEGVHQHLAGQLCLTPPDDLANPDRRICQKKTHLETLKVLVMLGITKNSSKPKQI